MVCISDLKHNCFVHVNIPKPSAMFATGQRNPDSANYSGDEFIDPGESKVDVANRVGKEFENAAAEASKGSKSE